MPQKDLSSRSSDAVEAAVFRSEFVVRAMQALLLVLYDGHSYVTSMLFFFVFCLFQYCCHRGVEDCTDETRSENVYFKAIKQLKAANGNRKKFSGVRQKSEKND